MIIFNRFESFYGELTCVLFRLINPFKKRIIKTEAKVHLFNNKQAVLLLKKYGYEDEFYLYDYYLKYINKGSVWADQDFRSASHFYNPIHKRGLFGQQHSAKVINQYYKKALKYWKKDKKNIAMFYLGACVHIIQDLTIPQHVIIRLFESHRRYENFVKLTYDIVEKYISSQPPILFDNINDYIDNNSKKALKLYKKNKHLNDQRLMFYKWTIVNLPLSQRTTAGCFLMFLKDVDYYY